MLVSIPPKISVSTFMGYLKGKSSLMIFDRFANLKYRYGNREFWLLIALGSYPKMVMVPHNLSEDFLFLIDKLGFRKLDSEMTLSRFRAITKPDLNPQLKELIQ